MSEEILIAGENKNLLGIVSKPKTIPNKAIILINSGIIHRLGPNRLYVKLARHLAGKGILVCRFDISGVGDSNIEDNAYSMEKDAPNDIFSIINAINQKYQINQFVLAGICSGADLALKTAYVDNRVKGLIFVNGEYFNFNEIVGIRPLLHTKTKVRYYIKAFFSLRHWIKVFTGKSKFINFRKIKNIIKLIFNRIVNVRGKSNTKKETHEEFILENNESEICKVWNDLVERNLNILQVYSEGSVAFDMYKMLKKSMDFTPYSNVSVKILKDVDHTFTLIWAQELILQTIDNFCRQTKVI